MAQGHSLRTEMERLHKTFNIDFVYDSSLPTDRAYSGPSLDGMTLRRALSTLFRGTGIAFRQKGRYVMLTSKPEKTPKNRAVKPSTRKQRTTRKAVAENEDTPDGGDTELGEVVVNGSLNSPLLSTQTGMRTLTKPDIMSAFALASTPDVVKTLQRFSGVAPGVELMSGLYVHGGDDDENLFLMDGSPLYSVNHTLGLFSSFNVDVVKSIDFYKSGFPARYGGRLSSVVDVRTADGDMRHVHGSYRIGLLDGSIHLEGPLRKDKTSFNIGLRRSWLDLITRPLCVIRNRHYDNDKLTLNYYFHDLNARVTNIFSDRSRMALSVYSGDDNLHSKEDMSDKYDYEVDKDITDEHMSWGNLNAAVDWQYKITPKMTSTLTTFYTYNRSRVTEDDDNSTIYQGQESSVDRISNSYRSTINDLGYRASADYRPSVHHHIRFGTDYTWHSFRPQTRSNSNITGESGAVDTTLIASHNSHVAHEWNAYAEDEVSVNDMWSLNAGVNASLFHIAGKTFASADPRLAVKFQVCPRLSFKASATVMSQYVHKIASTFIELPTDYWVPTTSRLRPMKSLQFAAGVYYQPDSHWLISMEGYIKRTRHILQYCSWTGLEPPADSWDEMVMDGRGRFYGLEVDAAYSNRDITLRGTYTLSWNKRRYPEFYPDWFYDKFDNRHKGNISAQWNISPKVSMFAVWSFHSGNRITVPTQYVRLPNVPDGHPTTVPGTSDDDGSGFVYEHPNNMTLPAYHRLDIGFDFKHRTRHGHEIVWNVSVYNAYCHMNSMWANVKISDTTGRMRLHNHAFIPAIPSLSYTYKF